MLSHHLIREARRRARLTQSELAMRAGTTQSAVARWEAGRSLPSLEKLQELVECCGLELGVSLGERRDAEERLLDQLRALTPEQRLQRLLAAIPFAGGEVAADATGAADEDERFEPVALLATLRRHEVRYVLIGGWRPRCTDRRSSPATWISRRRVARRTWSDWRWRCANSGRWCAVVVTRARGPPTCRPTGWRAGWCTGWRRASGRSTCYSNQRGRPATTTSASRGHSCNSRGARSWWHRWPT
ncbi:MAG: helix-turn-helix domain-containing protein [Gemmatimonadetes bacterium]|nr:helix-turn-helix domain-containing protein [Gemmatimonadota bacterium]